GAGVPRPLPLGDEDLDRVPLEGEVLLVRDAVLERGEALEALLHDLLRQLVLHGRRRGPRADRVLEGESAREPGGLDDLERALEVLLGLTGKPTMMSVVIAASGMRSRTRSRMPRNFLER